MARKKIGAGMFVTDKRGTIDRRPSFELDEDFNRGSTSNPIVSKTDYEDLSREVNSNPTIHRGYQEDKYFRVHDGKPGSGSDPIGPRDPERPTTPRDPERPTTPRDPERPLIPKEAPISTKVAERMAANAFDPQLPKGAVQKLTEIEAGPGEILDPAQFQMDQQEIVESAGYEAAQARLLSAEEAKNAELQGQGFVTPATAASYEAAAAEVATAEAAMKGRVSKLSSGATATPAKARAAIQDLELVDPKTQAKALTRDMPEGATVEHTLGKLLEGLETDNVPEWAKPAVSAAEAKLAAAGLSTSSVGKNAMYNAIIQSAMPIAQQDAKAKLAVFQQNVSNEQQAMLANSAFFQTLTVKNLDNRQQAAILDATNANNAALASAQNRTQASIANAQNFLQMDLANLNNAQQTNMVNAQMEQQAMLSNQSAENTARQFNAANEQQASQFNANLAASISQFNATQVNQAKQFNANASNAMKQFNAQIAFNRDQFNVQNATAIEQSNVQWRRQMNQINTAGTNAVNQANAMNQFNLSNQALTFLWQEQRDAAKWANDATQNEEERKTRMAIAALGNESTGDSSRLSDIKELAKAAASLYDSWGDT